MRPGCHSQVIKGLQCTVTDVTVQNTSALHYKYNFGAKGKQGWETGCSCAVWVWYAIAKISLILQVGLIKETKHSYWVQKSKTPQKNIQEPTGIWDQRHVRGVSSDYTLQHTATQNTLLQNQYCNLWMRLRPAYVSKPGKKPVNLASLSAWIPFQGAVFTSSWE